MFNIKWTEQNTLQNIIQRWFTWKENWWKDRFLHWNYNMTLNIVDGLTREKWWVGSVDDKASLIFFLDVSKLHTACY